jgi:hypothetical protein
MGDLLSSASLLLAAIAMVFSVWYPEIKSLSDKSIPDHDRDQHCSKLKRLFWSRAFPLALASIGVTIIYLPDCLNIIKRSAKAHFSPDAGQTYQYDAVATAFILVELLTIGLMVFLLYYVSRLISLIRQSR